jgi:hypothetical protein
VKFRNFKVYSLEKYRKRRKIILCMNVYCRNHLIRQEKVKFIFHLFFLCRIRDPDPGWQERSDPGSGSRIRDKHPGSATLYSGIKYLNGPAIPAPLFRHKYLNGLAILAPLFKHKISQWSGYTGTVIQAYDISKVRLYRHRYSGIKYLNGPAIPAPLFRHKISQ